MSSSIADRVRDLNEYIKTGRIVEAMNEFYAPNISMQEGNQEPFVGLEKNIQREKEFVASVKEFKRFDALSVGVDGDTALVEQVMEFVTKDGTHMKLEQVSRQKWADGKIVSERFYKAT